MQLFIWLTLLVTVTLAEKCPVPTNVEVKQAMVDHLLTYINKPDNPPAPVPTVDPAKLKGLGILPKRQVFSIFDERQWPEAITLLKKFMTAATFEDFIKVAETIYPRVNEDLFLYCFSVAIVHRPDAEGVLGPRVQDVYPDKFFEHYLLIKIKEKIMAGKKNPVLNDTHDFHNHHDPYRRVDYFTEDLGMNSHHYHWHVLHPMFWPEGVEDHHMDRVGELFYWMHRQMVARFDSELLSNHLPRISPFENWNEPIHIGYAPHLTVHRTGYRYMYRPDGLVLPDLPELTKSQMKRWKLRILKDIHKFNVTAANKTNIDIHDSHGIDILAHLLVSTTHSVNRRYYGNLHSYAHVIAARIADADGKHEEDNGVMDDVTVAARDPIFYQWHKFLDEIFQTYQQTLPPYNKYDLNWPGVTLDDVYVESGHTKEHNVLNTYWAINDFRIGKGFDFTLDTEAVIHMKHIDHEDFDYIFDVTNRDTTDKTAVFRIFLVPEHDETGHRFRLKEQRPMMIELDKFKHILKPGHNHIRKHSNDSSVTMPREHIYDSIKQWSPGTHDHNHCGWPEYMLLPKGSYEGMSYKLFVILTDYTEDKIPDAGNCHRKDSLSYCGTIFEQYPDRRPMGYPFDRPIYKRGWEEFKTPNMFTTDITIKFTGNTHLEH